MEWNPVTSMNKWLKKPLISLLVISSLTFQLRVNQPAFTCSKLAIETLEQDVKYVQSQ